MRISDWSSDVCSSDLLEPARAGIALGWRLGKGHGCISSGRSASGTDVAVPGGLAERKAGAPCRLKQTWRVTSSTDSSQAGPARVSKASRSISGPRRRCAAGSGRDRKSVVEGKSVSGRVDLGGGRIIQKKKPQTYK